jgi:hypothetical protein
VAVLVLHCTKGKKDVFQNFYRQGENERKILKKLQQICDHSMFMWPLNVTYVEYKKQIHQRIRNNGRLISDGGPGSSVGIATELRAGRSGDRIASLPLGAELRGCFVHALTAVVKIIVAFV